MKIAKVTPFYKSGKKNLMTNYRPISVLSCFSKILERIMYDCLYSYLNDNNLFFQKQFGFREGHSTNHALIELINSINDSFNQSKYTLGVFIDLSKGFDTVDHDILLKKLSLYGIKNNSLKWFPSYLSNRKQFIQAGDIKTSYEDIICGVPQGSILGPLLFIIYVNDLSDVSKILEPIMLADDANLFFTHKNIKELFQTVNSELDKVFQWFNANKLSLNKDKTKYTFFHKAREKDNIPLKLPALFINDKEIERVTSVKFLGVLSDEHLIWKEHITVIENKISKNLGLLYRAKRVLDNNALKKLYFSFFHSYLNYGNIAWASTSKTKLKKIASKQKEAVRVVNNDNADIRELMFKMKVLNIYKLNIYQVLTFMFKIKTNTALLIFRTQFKEIQHIYPTRFSKNSFIENQLVYSQTKFSVSSRGPRLWNNILDQQQKSIDHETIFKESVKLSLLSLENEIRFFHDTNKLSFYWDFSLIIKR